MRKGHQRTGLYVHLCVTGYVARAPGQLLGSPVASTRWLPCSVENAPSIVTLESSDLISDIAA